MSEPRRVLLTHYDLDGITCDIIISKLFQFEKKYMCGYAKMSNHIANGHLSGYDSAVVTDLSLTYGQFQSLTTEYGNKFLYIDHHKPSVEMVNNLETNDSLCFMDTSFSGAGIAFQVFKKKIKENILPFICAVDAYDCWRWRTHEKEFNIGYDLNVLFWKYGYNDFFDRFSTNHSIVFNDQEKKWISDHGKKRDESIINSDRTDFGDNSMVVLNASREYINDYGLQFPEYDIFYLLYTTISGGLSLSIRTTRKDIDVGKALKNAKMGNPYIYTAGGHPESGGVEFNDEPGLGVIIDVIETINDDLEGKPIDIPF